MDYTFESLPNVSFPSSFATQRGSDAQTSEDQQSSLVAETSSAVDEEAATQTSEADSSQAGLLSAQKLGSATTTLARSMDTESDSAQTAGTSPSSSTSSGSDAPDLGGGLGAAFISTGATGGAIFTASPSESTAEATTVPSTESSSSEAAVLNGSGGGVGAAFVSTGATGGEIFTASESDAGDGTPGAEGVGSNAQAENGEPSDSAFQLPGRSLQVLPIGLGVFAGVSTVALLVVGVVTYERKKYRQRFRERKAAEESNGRMR